MAERSSQILKGETLKVGQSRAPNTVELRKKYTEYLAETMGKGETPDEFETWAKKNFPDQKILNQ